MNCVVTPKRPSSHYLANQIAHSKHISDPSFEMFFCLLMRRSLSRCVQGQWLECQGHFTAVQPLLRETNTVNNLPFHSVSITLPFWCLAIVILLRPDMQLAVKSNARSLWRLACVGTLPGMQVFQTVHSDQLLVLVATVMGCGCIMITYYDENVNEIVYLKSEAGVNDASLFNFLN